jgi:hypothetical protein
MDRREAVQYLHDRHPEECEPPGAVVELQALHLEVFWLQAHSCELIEEREQDALRECFASIHRLLTRGDSEVQDAVCHHYVAPDLVFHPDLAWAKQLMPPLLAELCSQVRQALDEESAKGSADDPGDSSVRAERNTDPPGSISA